MLGLGGQLGVNALGAFELAALQTSITFVPHRGRAHGANSRTALSSAIARTRVVSAISSPRVKAEVSDE